MMRFMYFLRPGSYYWHAPYSTTAKMSKPVLYKRDASPPSCAVMMLGDIIGLEFEYKEPDLLGLEHRSPKFKKINPMATIPVLKDGDFIVSESHAIMKYLLEKYGGVHREDLYPSDIQTRAIIDQCMFFNAGVMFNRLKNVALPTLLLGMEGPSDKAREEVNEGFAVIEAYLEKNCYIAADHMTIADLCVASTATAIQVIQKLDANKFPRCSEWLARLGERPYFQKINKPGSALFSQLMLHFWAKNKKKVSQ